MAELRGTARQRGRLIELPVLGAVLVVIGVWLGGRFHPAGYVLALIPVALWAGLSLAHFAARAARARRQRRAIVARLRELAAQGFDPAFVIEGDLGWGEEWAAFDFARGEFAVLTEHGAARHALAAIDAVSVGEGAHRLGEATPLYYSLNIDLARSGEARAARRVSVAARLRRTAQRWADDIQRRLAERGSAAPSPTPHKPADGG